MEEENRFCFVCKISKDIKSIHKCELCGKIITCRQKKICFEEGTFHKWWEIGITKIFHKKCLDKQMRK